MINTCRPVLDAVYTILAILGSLFFSLDVREKVESCSLISKEAKEAHAAAKARFRRFLQDGYLARVLQDGRLSCKTLANRTVILQDLARILQDLARWCVILQDSCKNLARSCKITLRFWLGVVVVMSGAHWFWLLIILIQKQEVF